MLCVQMKEQRDKQAKKEGEGEEDEYVGDVGDVQAGKVGHLLLGGAMKRKPEATKSYNGQGPVYKMDAGARTNGIRY